MTIQTQPTFTWRCPRCKHQMLVPGPYSDNCPQCNYPDPPPKGSEVKAGDPFDVALGPEAALSAQSPDDLTRAAAVPPLALGAIDWDWLRECVEGAVDRYFDAEPPNWQEVIVDVRTAYEAPRPTLLCGCLAGRHPNTLSAMQEAHPERVAGS